ncbi:hypothetical protein K504DRAFT_535823 [Pleomassaria siparia CBS 279.74]|uniref:Uncharacterized protein n=1 Tax=Pleomassaria siparia CBS 279.74 TaxID=1314801 RepID=A0A6G1K361_9PLEO|nr:hypothetical protein K504DRAFT_535823 [Pleomassaria siparia CBS 279.74]
MFSLPASKREEETFPGSCPSGGEWYACSGTSVSNFVGCCSSDPCSTGCSQGNTKAGSFDPTYNVTAPDASCGTASNFYTCNSGTKTFWGCCKTNPCQQQQTCPDGDLVPAFMDRNEQFIAYTGASKTTTSTPSSTPTSEVQSPQTVVIIAGAVGGGLGLAAIVAILIFCLCRRKNRSKYSRVALETSPSDTTPMDNQYSRHASKHSDTLSQYPCPSPFVSPNPNSYPSSSAFGYQFEHNSQHIQELPAELYPSMLKPTSEARRYSELPASTATDLRGSASPSTVSESTADIHITPQTSSNPNRLSELPAEGLWMAELESPRLSPRPQVPLMAESARSVTSSFDETLAGTEQTKRR